MRVSKSDQSQIVDTAGLWISSSLSELFLGLSLALLEHKDNARSDVHGLEKVALSFGLREALHNPTVDPAVALLKSLLNERVDNSIRYGSSCGIGLGDYPSNIRVLGNHLREKLFSAYPDKTELLRKQLCLSGSTRARWALDDNLWWSPGRLLAESDSHHADKVCLNLLLLKLRGINFKKEALEDFLYSKNIEVVLLMDVPDGSFEVLALEVWILLEQVLLDFGC